MKKLLLISAILLICLSGKIERYNLYTLSWYGGRPHTGICLEDRSLSEIFTTLYDMTDTAGTLPPEKEKMYWKVYSKRRWFASGTWVKGMNPIVYGYEPIKLVLHNKQKGKDND